MEKQPLQLICQLAEYGQAVVKNEKFELFFATPKAFEQPYDFDRVNCAAEWLLPDGTKVMTDGFWYVGYERSLVKEKEILSPTGQEGWMIRYSPRQSGEYRLIVTLTDHDTGETWCWPENGQYSFIVEDQYQTGFLKVDETDPAYLRLDDGSFFLGIGHNLCGWEWGGTDNRKGTYEYDRWLEQMHENLANLTHFDFCEGDQIEWTAHPDELPYSNDWNGLGQYNQQNAWKMDYRIQRSEELGIYFRLSLYHWEDFDTESENFPDWGWNRNPYNLVNGGPCSNVFDFFTKEEAMQLVKQYLRYVVARWGYSPNLMAYELWNEVDSPDIVWGIPSGYTGCRKQIAAWHQVMATYLHEVDVNGHLVTTSCASSNNGSEIWKLSEIDISTIHRYTHYNPDYMDTRYETIATVNKLSLSRLRSTNKPVIIGEFALSPGGDVQKVWDPKGIAFHQQLWSSVMARSLGTAMHWTWGSYIDRLHLYSMYKPLAMLFEDADLRGLFATNTLKGDGPMGYMALTGQDRLYLWAYDRDYCFESAKRGYKPPLIEEQCIILPFSDGEYIVTWMDTYTGDVIDQSTLKAENGEICFPVPAFERDIACKIEPAGEIPVLQSQDIGVNRAGTATAQYGRKAFIEACGVGFRGNKDQGRFAYLKIEGDFILQARVDSINMLGEFQQSGLMLRSGLEADSPMVFFYLTPYGYSGILRRGLNGDTLAKGPNMPLGSYLRLERKNGMIRGFVSAIRGEWALVDEVDAYSMPNSVYLGLAAHSNNNYTRAVSAFSDVRYQLEMQGNV